MKHLVKFNELKNSTYLNASSKANDIRQYGRSKKFLDPVFKEFIGKEINGGRIIDIHYNTLMHSEGLKSESINIVYKSTIWPSEGHNDTSQAQYYNYYFENHYGDWDQQVGNSPKYKKFDSVKKDNEVLTPHTRFGSEDYKTPVMSRKDAVLLIKIISKINPDSLFKDINKNFDILDYKSKP